MVMEYVEGDALPDWLGPRRPLVEGQVAALAAPLLDGLEAVHDAGYMHRDIKPGNIYVRADGSPVLLDFGSARQKNDELTAVVTPGYAPFEQYHARGKQGPWSDLYALAGVLYWVVSGSRPLEAVARVREDTMPSAVQVGDRSRYRAEFLAAIDWALSPFEDQRPQTIPEWRSALLADKPLEVKTEKAQKAAPAARLSADALKRAEQRLAEHIGPVAGVVVRRAAAKARDEAELYLMLADEIENKEEKKAFIRNAVSVSGRPAEKA
jgi:serine/threonine protein kinase